jgi:hypothetical protein
MQFSLNGGEARLGKGFFDVLSVSHNTLVYASPPVGGSGSVLARSFRCAPFPFPRQNSATFCQPWTLLRKALIRAGKTS